MLYCDHLQDNLNDSLWLERLEKGEKQSLTVTDLAQDDPYSCIHTWPRRSLQLQTWPRWSLQLHDQNDPYSCILDQDDPYSYMTRMILTVTYLTKTISVSLNFTTSFQSPALPLLTHVTQLPCFQAKIHETEVSQSCGMESKVTGSLFQA